MATATKKVTTRELRNRAKQAGISGWEDMDPAELKAALAASNGSSKSTKKSKTAATVAAAGRGPKKSTAQKESAKSAANRKAREADSDEESDPTNPFKNGTNLWHITEALKQGGTRKSLVKSLKKKIDLKPRTKGGEDFDLDAELDRRILIVGQILRNDHGFEVVREGRGYDEGTIVATPPE